MGPNKSILPRIQRNTKCDVGSNTAYNRKQSEMKGCYMSHLSSNHDNLKLCQWLLSVSKVQGPPWEPTGGHKADKQAPRGPNRTTTVGPVQYGVGRP